MNSHLSNEFSIKMDRKYGENVNYSNAMTDQKESFFLATVHSRCSVDMGKMIRDDVQIEFCETREKRAARCCFRIRAQVVAATSTRP